VQAFFLICFLFGAGLSLLSLLSGTAHLAIPGTHALHFGHAPSGATVAQKPSPLNLSAVLAFLLWFGGVGFLLTSFSPLGLILVLMLAVLAGVMGGAIILALFVKVLLPAQTFTDPEIYRLEGTPGRITASIPAGGTGEITYSKAGTRRSDAARSIDGATVTHGEDVVILAYRSGVAYVQTLDKYLNTSAATIAAELAAIDKDSIAPPAVHDATDADAGSHS
jgi:hypothetical protein